MNVAPTDAERMNCMEVWGGNSVVDRAFQTAGLNVWLHSRPYAEAAAGGDVYYVSSCASGRITRLLLADVCGHGQSVADVAVGLRDLMRRNINVINQVGFIRAMNQQFSERSPEDGFATALVCTFFAPSKRLQFCNAGHPVPYLFRVRRGEWAYANDQASTEVATGVANTPLGVIEDAGYSRFDIKLETGDMILSLSDAYPESVDEQGQLLGAEGILNLINELDAAQPGELIPELNRRIDALHAGNLRQDDATALVFMANGDQSSLVETLKSPFRLFGPVRDRTAVQPPANG